MAIGQTTGVFVGNVYFHFVLATDGKTSISAFHLICHKELPSFGAKRRHRFNLFANDIRNRLQNKKTVDSLYIYL